MLTSILSGVIIFLSLAIAGLSYGFYKLMKINIESEEASTALWQELEKFRSHLEEVYSRDTFYGDEVLGSLLDHARDLNVYVKSFIDDTSLPENDYIQEEVFENDDTETGS